LALPVSELPSLYDVDFSAGANSTETDTLRGKVLKCSTKVWVCGKNNKGWAQNKPFLTTIPVKFE